MNSNDMIKKAILLFLIFSIIFSSVVFASKVGDVAGKYFYTDIEAFINGKKIDSWNIGGKTLISIEELRDYGFNVEWDEEMRQIRGNINVEPIVLRETSKPLYKGEYTEWVDSTIPAMTLISDPHGKQVEFVEAVSNEIVIKFAKKMSPNYMNSEYIPVIQNGKNISDKFKYTYDQEESTLKLKLIDYYIDISHESSITDANGNTEHFMEGKVDVYLLKGILTDNKEKLPLTLRLTASIEWKIEN